MLLCFAKPFVQIFCENGKDYSWTTFMTFSLQEIFRVYQQICHYFYFKLVCAYATERNNQCVCTSHVMLLGVGKCRTEGIRYHKTCNSIWTHSPGTAYFVLMLLTVCQIIVRSWVPNLWQANWAAKLGKNLALSIELLHDNSVINFIWDELYHKDQFLIP